MCVAVTSQESLSQSLPTGHWVIHSKVCSAARVISTSDCGLGRADRHSDRETGGRGEILKKTDRHTEREREQKRQREGGGGEAMSRVKSTTTR